MKDLLCSSENDANISTKANRDRHRGTLLKYQRYRVRGKSITSLRPVSATEWVSGCHSLYSETWFQKPLNKKHNNKAVWLVQCVPSMREALGLIPTTPYILSEGSKMAPWEKLLPHKSENLRSVPGVHNGREY